MSETKLTPRQCKMARAGLGLSASDLAEAANLKRLTVARFETDKPIASDSLEKIAKALEDKGAEFQRRKGRVAVAVPGE